CAAAAYGGWRRRPQWVASARSATLLLFPLLTITCASLVYSLATLNFHLQYVTQVTSHSMPTYLRITALWGGQAGSLLFWSWLMAAFTFAVMLREWRRDRDLLPWVIIVTA